MDVNLHLPKNCSLKILSNQDLPAKYLEQIEQAPRNMKKRTEDYLLSRLATQECFEGLGVEFRFTVAEVSSGISQPSGWICSITHSKPFAACLAAKEPQYHAIGIDLESRERTVSQKFAQRIATARELEWIKSDPALSNDRTILLFSAKESVYKALRNKLSRFSYQAIELLWQDDRFIGHLNKYTDWDNQFEVLVCNYKQTHLLTCLIIQEN